MARNSQKRPWPFAQEISFSESTSSTSASDFGWTSTGSWGDESEITPFTSFSNIDIFNPSLPDLSSTFNALQDSTRTTQYSPDITNNNPPSNEQSSSNGTQQTCFGSIIDIKARLRLVPLINHSNKTAFCFPVIRQGICYALQYSNSAFAVMNKKTCDDIQSLSGIKEISFLAFIAVKEWTNACQAQRLSAGTVTMTLDVNIYGQKEDAAEVGRLLSASGVFLQQPLLGLENVVYYNPHVLHAQEILGGFVHETPRLHINTHIHEPLEIEANPRESKHVDASSELDSILDSLSHHKFLHIQSQVVDRRLRTKPLPHQLEALDFIHQLETGQIAPELSLWKAFETDNGDKLYRHVFTGAKRAEPKEALGGILADDMGLGKSLVMLSTIASSLDRAESFASVEQANPPREPLKELPSKATLVVVPSSLLIDSWLDEVRRHVYPGCLTCYKYHGHGRQEDRDRLFSSDIVFTTYATIASERRHGILRQATWFRIVLDEAHDIRNRSTKKYQSIIGLMAKHRWCLTGTPIQNSIEDLGAIVTFLKVPVLDQPTTFRRYIMSPTTSQHRDRFKNLRQLLEHICLRRTRELLHLPNPDPQIREIVFTPYEREEYDKLQMDCKRHLDMIVSRRGGKGTKSTILQSLLRLRLYCNNGSNACQGPADADETLSYLQQNEEALCAYCGAPIYFINDMSEAESGTLIPGCLHLVCQTCQPQFSAENKRCPRCAAGGNDDDDNDTALDALRDMSMPQGFAPVTLGYYPGPRYPTKLMAFLQDIRYDLSHKSIVFSSWKKTLDLTGQLLMGSGIPFYCIHGSLSHAERVNVLRMFRLPAGANVLLMTLGTGAEGLNLAVASRIYLLEPQWNPSVELQAVGRSLRLGQQQQVKIVRYIMKDTIEDSNVLSRQRSKLQQAGGGFEKRKRGNPSERDQALYGFFGVQPRAET